LIEVGCPVKDQILRRRIAGECPPQLLCDSRAIGMAGDFPVQDSSPVM
jgi:hypothetical protein